MSEIASALFQGQEAQDYLDKHPLVLTKTQSEDLSNAVLKSHFKEVERMYNNKISSGRFLQFSQKTQLF